MSRYSDLRHFLTDSLFSFRFSKLPFLGPTRWSTFRENKKKSGEVFVMDLNAERLGRFDRARYSRCKKAVPLFVAGKKKCKFISGIFSS